MSVQRLLAPYHTTPAEAPDEIRSRPGQRDGVGCVEGAVFHLWHGRKEDRRYLERYTGFRVFDFDPRRDIAVAASGCWQWSMSKPDMHRYVRDYFHGRREDA